MFLTKKISSWRELLSVRDLPRDPLTLAILPIPPTKKLSPLIIVKEAVTSTQDTPLSPTALFPHPHHPSLLRLQASDLVEILLKLEEFNLLIGTRKVTMSYPLQ
jgi:hypothetical protein